MNDAPGRYHAPGRSKCARNHQALNTGRAFVYLADAHVAIDFREAELLQIAIAAKRLDCARAHRLGRLRGDELGHRGLGQAGQTRILDRKSTPSELQSLMRISYAVFCLNKKTYHPT